LIKVTHFCGSKSENAVGYDEDTAISHEDIANRQFNLELNGV
jgi:hypothetical protein